VSDFGEVFDEWLTETVEISPRLGAGAEGVQYGEPQRIEGCMIDDSARLIRASDGNQIVSDTTIYVPTSRADAVELHARVKLPSGRVATAERIARPEVYGIFDFVVVNLA